MATAASPSMSPIATVAPASLHMSSRTLRRHLTAEGTSYRALVDEVRERLAEELLATGIAYPGEVNPCANHGA